MTVQVRLLAGRDRPVRLHHPWIFSGAIERVDGDPAPGDVVDVTDAHGAWLGRGYFNPRSQIVVRLLTWDPAEQAGPEFWRGRLARAAALRHELRLDAVTSAWRLAYAESDGLPGLVVDRYDQWLAVQFLTLGVEARREMLLDLLQQLFSPRGIVERSDVTVRRLEGLSPSGGLLRGEVPPQAFEILEHALHFPVDLLGGQKTGFYLDQRENRRIVGGYAAGRRVLNAFSFTGAFGVYALAGGAARVINIDSSYDALLGAEAALAANGFDPDARAEAICGDVFEVLRDFREQGARFDMIILDPPKFARRKSELETATRGYKDINLLALGLLAPGGLLATFSCSGLLSPELFQKIVFGAATDAAREVQILARLSQGPDHPILLSFPEGAYLKGLLCRAA